MDEKSKTEKGDDVQALAVEEDVADQKTWSKSYRVPAKGAGIMKI